MTDSKDPIPRAKAQVAEWKAEREQFYAECRFDRCTPAELVKIAETMRDLQGRPLDTASDWVALDGAWYRAFGEWLSEPAGEDENDNGGGDADGLATASVPLDQHPVLAVPDDKMLRPRDVRRLFGYARSTLRRHITAGKFPKPLETVPGERFIGWPAGQLKAWLKSHAREATRH